MDAVNFSSFLPCVQILVMIEGHKVMRKKINVSDAPDSNLVHENH